MLNVSKTQRAILAELYIYYQYNINSPMQVGRLQAHVKQKDENQFVSDIDYLKKLGYIESPSMDMEVSITMQGIEYYQDLQRPYWHGLGKSLKSPDRVANIIYAIVGFILGIVVDSYLLN